VSLFDQPNELGLAGQCPIHTENPGSAGLYGRRGGTLRLYDMPHEVATQKTEWSFSRPVLSLDGDFLALAALLANRKQMPAGVADGGGQRRLVNRRDDVRALCPV